VIKAVRVRSGADIQSLSSFHTDYHLLDSYAPGMPGGTGETFAWEIARGHRGSVPMILSGGLNPGNVADAIAAVRPFAVDVASGVESSPGRKDPAKLRAFADAVAATGAHQLSAR
jgi:phosphoribosylanthranilate isomerase